MLFSSCLQLTHERSTDRDLCQQVAPEIGESQESQLDGAMDEDEDRSQTPQGSPAVRRELEGLEAPLGAFGSPYAPALPHHASSVPRKSRTSIEDGRIASPLVRALSLSLSLSLSLLSLRLFESKPLQASPTGLASLLSPALLS